MALRPSGRAVVVGFMIALSLAAVASAADSRRAAEMYVSKRFHYSLRVPAGFKTVPATSNALPAFYPTGESIAADRFLHGAYKIVIDSVPTAQALAAWTKARGVLISQQFGCDKPTKSAAHLAGTSALQLDYKSCSGTHLDVIEAVHSGRGYDVLWLGATNVQPMLGNDVSTFRFLP